MGGRGGGGPLRLPDGAPGEEGEEQPEMQRLPGPAPAGDELRAGDDEHAATAAAAAAEPVGVVLHGGGADVGVPLPLDWLEEAHVRLFVAAPPAQRRGGAAAAAAAGGPRARHHAGDGGEVLHVDGQPVALLALQIEPQPRHRLQVCQHLFFPREPAGQQKSSQRLTKSMNCIKCSKVQAFVEKTARAVCTIIIDSTRAVDHATISWPAAPRPLPTTAVDQHVLEKKVISY